MTGNDNKPPVAAVPPLDEERFSEALRTALDQLEGIALGLCRCVIHLENVHSEILVRKLAREGKAFKADEFGKKD